MTIESKQKLVLVIDRARAKQTVLLEMKHCSDVLWCADLSQRVLLLFISTARVGMWPQRISRSSTLKQNFHVWWLVFFSVYWSGSHRVLIFMEACFHDRIKKVIVNFYLTILRLYLAILTFLFLELHIQIWILRYKLQILRDKQNSEKKSRINLKTARRKKSIYHLFLVETGFHRF